MNDVNENVVVDARGYACPEPVMLARSGLLRNKGKALRVLVDTATSRDNLLRLAAREGVDASAEAYEGGFAVDFKPRPA